MDQAYGKFGQKDLNTEIIMEYNQFFPFMTNYLPDELGDNADFVAYLSQPKILEEFAEMFMMTLPGDRLDFYKTSDVAKMRKNIYAYTNEIAAALGEYPVTAKN